MYVVTFYSYKGGVGRTMALVNTAVMLARLGRRVLVVDFDLEAPGLPSYQVFRDCNCSQGIVDYVSAYRSSGVAPNASEFITKCDVDGSAIWLMPAGNHTRLGYSEMLQAIDWQELYEHESGYLMFEDLRQQWAQHEGQGFDYVLIDSRTGHTDVGGICTRQLPDAVVIMFVPNDQNIAGLAPIVDSIRDAERPNGRSISLHFCASNVPDLDDEKEILRKLLDEARQRLKYDKADVVDAHVINHYSSLEILTQSAFALSRPNSRLTKQYDALRTMIISKNFDDREGAIVALRKMPAAVEHARMKRGVGARDRLRTDAVNIFRKHRTDGEVAYLSARAFNEIGDHEAELDALNSAIEAGYEINRSRFQRVFLSLMLERRDQASADLLEILSSPTATVFELGPALELAETIEGLWTTAVERALDRPDSEFNALHSLVVRIMMRRDALPLVARRMQQCMESNSLDETQQLRARNTAIIALLGYGDFSAAKMILGALDFATAPIEDVFNDAIADWAIKAKPPRNTFEAFIQRFATDARNTGANAYQCLALAHGVLGNLEHAHEALNVAESQIRPGKPEFTCWRYLYVSGDEMAQDLTEMRTRLETRAELLPPFLNETRKTFH